MKRSAEFRAFDNLVEKLVRNRLKKCPWFAESGFHDSILMHCCPKQDRVVVRSVESKSLVGGKTVISG
jgi:hypothetical protein